MAGEGAYVGVSSYNGAATCESQKILAALGTPLTIHQPVYNPMNRWVEDDLLPHTGRLGIGVIAFCPAQGLLTSRYLRDPKTRAPPT